jgi:hypothetical protein
VRQDGTLARSPSSSPAEGRGRPKGSPPPSPGRTGRGRRGRPCAPAERAAVRTKPVHPSNEGRPGPRMRSGDGRPGLDGIGRGGCPLGVPGRRFPPVPGWGTGYEARLRVCDGRPSLGARPDGTEPCRGPSEGSGTPTRSRGLPIRDGRNLTPLAGGDQYPGPEDRALARRSALAPDFGSKLVRLSRRSR